jgi:hypothetical protein
VRLDTMSSYKLVVFDGDHVLEETGLDYALDAAEVDAEWKVDHDGATKVEIVNDLGDVVQTVGEKRRARV